jgi:hypothetical protein
MEEAASLVKRSGQGERGRSVDREGDDVVPALEVDVEVAARADDDVLLAVHAAPFRN